jgi:hypothetical protein
MFIYGYAECRYAEHRYAECRGALLPVMIYLHVTLRENEWLKKKKKMEPTVLITLGFDTIKISLAH